MVIQWEEPDTPNGQVIVSARRRHIHFSLFFFAFFPFSEGDNFSPFDEWREIFPVRVSVWEV